MFAAAVFAAGRMSAAVLPADSGGRPRGEVVNVTDFGAVPDDGRDDTRALRRAAEYCRTHPGTTLVMPAGVYRLRDAEAERLEEEVLAGKMGANPEEVIFKPYYPYVKGLDFTGAEDVTVEARGAVLMCEGWMEPVSVVDCRNFSLCGLTIDYLRKPFSEGVVTSVDDGSFTVRFRSERMITAEMPIPRLMLWDDSIAGIYRDPFYFPERELLGDNCVRFSGSLPQRMAGAAVAAPHSFHFRPAILLLRSTNTLLEGVTIHSQPGMGIVGFDSRDVTIRRLSVETVKTQNKKALALQGDDATNVHGYYHDIAAVKGDTVSLELRAPTFTHAQVADVPRVGDRMEIVRISTLEPVGETEVVEVFYNEGDTDARVRLRDAVPEAFGDYYLFNVTKLPRLEFRRSVVWGNLARGVLAKTRGVRIEDNIFRGCTGTAIHVGAESSWKEGTHAADVTIERNVMTDCGLGAGCQYGASGIAVVIGAPDTEGTTLHDGIRIIGNTIRGTDGNACGISIRNARNVEVRGNRIEGCDEAVQMRSCENVTVD